MEPTYVSELRYTHLVGTYQQVKSLAVYQADTPETVFERTVSSLFLQGQEQLHREEYALALRSFRELQALILNTVNPQLPVDPNTVWWKFPFDVSLIDLIGSQAVKVLNAAPEKRFNLPAEIASQVNVLPEAISKDLIAAPIRVSSFQATVGPVVASGAALAAASDWEGALAQYTAALDEVPAGEKIVRSAMLQDIALLNEKAGKSDVALQFAQDALKAAKSAPPDAQVTALDVATGIARRAGNADLATKFSGQADELRATNNLNPLVFRLAAAPEGAGADGVAFGRAARFARVQRFGGAFQPQEAMDAAAAVAVAAPDMVAQPQLIASQVIGQAAGVRTFVAQGFADQIALELDGDAPTKMRSFLKSHAEATDLRLISAYLVNPTKIVAYLPHMYFFTIPMAIGDCLAGLGDLDEAIATYRGILVYPLINQTVENVDLWTRLAQAYLDQGDRAYREARDDLAAYDAAREAYEQIVAGDGTVPGGSALYADASFAGIRTRMEAFLAAADKVAHDDNPALTSIVLQALTRLQQIAAGLNFFGFAPDYLPPFSFEYLQTTTRYFAQQASQAEQRYIQFKSQAENEQLQRDQLAQQADVARQSVVLEQRGVAEAQRGVDAANASINYANVQLNNAKQAKQDFDDNRWELLGLAEAEAWASAAAVDKDDEVLLTWTGNAYNSKDKRRSVVLKELAYKRTRLSQDLEANRLGREIASAQAYTAVAQAQRGQALARVATAQQRVVVAQLQQKYAEQNRDFLDMKEFGAQLWYDLAAQAKRLRTRYLDMATEMAFLTERAYNAETGREIHAVQYDYGHTSSGNLMGADLLLADVDYFTYDLVTTTKTRKQPIKTTISLADAYPVQFSSFASSGVLMFETALEDFDRLQPGLYLAKLRSVEVTLIGVTSATTVSGTLRNVGVSRFRAVDGTVVERHYPADVMVLSQFDLRADALVFPFSPNDLRLFENNGVATSWQLELPAAANDFDLSDIVDVHIGLYYDGFFDPTLETQVRAALPTTGSASRAVSMAMSFPDELFYLVNKGEGELTIDASLFAANQRNAVRTSASVKITGSGGGGVSLTLTSANAGEMSLTTDADGVADDSAAASPLRALRGKSALDVLTVTISAADNPGLVTDGALDPDKLGDVLVFFEYTFDYA
ncbi:hypothetical protein AAIB33_17840 [Microbacterium sp. AZCO]|uniref:Tc toxin subunit A-related protein n=1 Tax=Microbacterium sp. AZCO TaxID=3142976 RepID=UPI0031F369F2